MKIRATAKKENDMIKPLYVIEDEEGKITEINISYLETAIRILKLTSERANIRNAKAFEKFINNLTEATKYYDKAEKVYETPGEDLDKEELYNKKAAKYDRKAQALFTTHKNWYKNLPDIIEEIKVIFEESYAHINEETERIAAAIQIDNILTKYKKIEKEKTL